MAKMKKRTIFLKENLVLQDEGLDLFPIIYFKNQLSFGNYQY